MVTTPIPAASDRRPRAIESSWSRNLTDRLLWLCPAGSLVIIALLLWLFGLTVWTAIAIVFLIACPSLVLWIWLAEPSFRKASGNKQ